jgi:hypothetical protein
MMAKITRVAGGAALAVLGGPCLAVDCAPQAARCVGSGQEYATIQAAANVVNPGDTVWVFDGNYAPFDVTRSGTSAQPITFRAVNPWGAVLTSSKSAHGHQAAIMVFLADHVTIDGFKVDLRATDPGPSGEHAISCYGWDPPQHGCVIRNNWTAGARVANIFSAFSEGILVEDNFTFGSEDEHGIYVSNSQDNPIIRRNVTFDNNGAGIHVNGDIESPPGDGIISNALIDSNTIHGNGNNCSAALSMDGVQNSVVRNNLIYDNDCQSITNFCIDGGGGPKNNAFVNNTVIVPPGASSSNWAIKIQGKSGCADQGGHTIFNNILLRTNGDTGSISIENANVVSDYNRVSDRLRRNGTVATLSTWKGWGYDAHSSVETEGALFVDAAGEDYHLQAGAAAVDGGVAALAGIAAPVLDLEQAARPQGSAYDNGAFERAGGGGNPPPAAPTNVVRTDTK